MKKSILMSEKYGDGGSRDRDGPSMMSAIYKYALCSNVKPTQNAFYDIDSENAKIAKEVDTLNFTTEFLLSKKVSILKS